MRIRQLLISCYYRAISDPSTLSLASLSRCGETRVYDVGRRQEIGLRETLLDREVVLTEERKSLREENALVDSSWPCSAENLRFSNKRFPPNQYGE